MIQPDFDPVHIAKGYEAGGAACLSVLTDRKYFQGGFENLKAIRGAGVTCPLLCKEFIVDAYQIMKVWCLSPGKIHLTNQNLSTYMRTFGDQWKRLKEQPEKGNKVVYSAHCCIPRMCLLLPIFLCMRSQTSTPRYPQIEQYLNFWV